MREKQDVDGAKKGGLRERYNKRYGRRETAVVAALSDNKNDSGVSSNGGGE